MIKDTIINHSMNMISRMNKYNKEELEQVQYGLESIYVALSKVIVILLISAILGLFKYSILLLLLFNILRIVAFGLHASKSIYCWISSTIAFIFIPYICVNHKFSLWFFIVISIISFISFVLYAPADTIKRPLINSNKRKIYKTLSILFAAIYIILIFTIDNTLIKNMLTFALIIETILILPITYKIFKLPYNNYKNYKG